MDKLSIVIVTYNCGDYLVNCIKSLEQSSGNLELDIWVVDNCSSDDSIAKAKKLFPKLHFLINKENLGFSKANNLALKKIKTEYVLILNPDTLVEPGVLVYMMKYMEEHSDVGAASCRVELANHQIDWSSHRGFPTPWASFQYYFLKNDQLYHLTDRNFSQPHEVDGITGAFFFTRKSVLEKVGYFDEKYFMYAEDLDLCYRIKKTGYKIMYLPEVKITHFKGISSGIKQHSQQISQAIRESKVRALNAFYETMKIFYRKNLAKKYPFLINWFVLWGINLKWELAKRKMSV